jgi:hypothetical protein
MMNRYPVSPHIAKQRAEGERSERERTLQLSRLALLGKLVDMTGMPWNVDIQQVALRYHGPVEYRYLCSPVIPALSDRFFTFVLVDISPDYVDCRTIELRAEIVLDLWKMDLQRDGLSDEAIAAIMYGNRGGRTPVSNDA